MEDKSAEYRYRNQRHRAVANVLYTSNHLTTRLQSILSEHNLTLQQYNILRILARQHPKPACNYVLRNQMLDSRSDITRIVDRLVKEGLVVRKHCNDDRRKVNINITPKGLILLQNLDQINEKMDGIADMLSTEEINKLNQMLEKLRDHS